MTEKRAASHSGCSQNPLQDFMLIPPNYWIEGPWTGIWAVVLLLPLVCDPVVQYLSTSVSRPIYVYAKLVMLLYSPKVLGGFLGFCNASQTWYKQTCESTPSTQAWAQEVLLPVLSRFHGVREPLHDRKFMGQMLSKYKTAEYTWVV